MRLDEVFLIGEDSCPLCRGKDKAELFAGAVNRLYGHCVEKRGLTMYMWGDRLLDYPLPYRDNPGMLGHMYTSWDNITNKKITGYNPMASTIERLIRELSADQFDFQHRKIISILKAISLAF